MKTTDIERLLLQFMKEKADCVAAIGIINIFASEIIKLVLFNFQNQLMPKKIK
jgi:hypothetical protein